MIALTFSMFSSVTCPRLCIIRSTVPTETFAISAIFLIVMMAIIIFN